MSSQLLMVVTVLLIPQVQYSQTSHLNYVKPSENATCPTSDIDPCLTFEEYRQDADEYFVSGTEFVFIPGDYLFHGRLKLVNVSNMYFHAQGGEKQKVRIFVSFSSNLTFTTSNNITLSHMTFIIGGTHTAYSNISYYILIFQWTFDVQLFNLTFFGDGNTYGQTAIMFYFSSGCVGDIQTVELTSNIGAALIILNSTVILSGDNSFVNNTALGLGGAFFMAGSNVSISGRNYFVGNSALQGGGAVSITETIFELTGTALFRHNSAALAGGALIISNSDRVNVTGGNLSFIENSAKGLSLSTGHGAAIYVDSSYMHMTGQIMVQGNTANHGGIRAELSTVTIMGNVVFIGNYAHFSGGAVSSLTSQLYFSGFTLERNNALVAGGAINVANSSVIIADSVFVENSARGIGGVIQLTMSSFEFRGTNHIKGNVGANTGISAYWSKLYFNGNNYLTNNAAKTGFGSAIFISLTQVSILGTLKFISNHGRNQGGALVVGPYCTLDFDQYANVSFESNTAEHGGAIYTVHSTWNIRGNLTFYNNSAFIGGAMFLSRNTKLILNKYTKINFAENHADTNGGAIFLEDSGEKSQCRVLGLPVSTSILRIDVCYEPNSTNPQICKYLIDCFIELNADIPFDVSTSNISISFHSNFAGKTGTAIFGGFLDNCRLYLGGGFQDSCGNKIGRVYNENPLEIVLKLLSIDNMTSAISSEPLQVCFCNKSLPDCEMNIETFPAVRGKQFALSAVTVGQGNFTVPSSIKADFNNVSTGVELSIHQRIQDTGNTCTDIFYRIFTAENFVTLVLFPDGPCRDTGISRREVKILFLPCPDGFVQVGSECVCDKRLSAFNVTCDVDRESILRIRNSFWVMALYDNFSYHGLILYQAGCPFDYCVETATEVMLNNSDVQCNHNHSGMICGACQDELSLALGSLHCLPCSNAYLSLVLLFSLAGIMLVALLLLLRLTVAFGTINGLIFYANVVQMNRAIFFPPGVTNVLTIFIAWLNLDLGIETCFYNGMDMYAFTWLQFAFPFYVWFLIGFIIFLSRYSTTITRALGSNPVSVLATLLLVSYSKILRIIVSVLSRTSLQYPDGSYQGVWLYDGNIPYFQRADHITLAVFAIFALIFLFLPYTILLLCGHWLQAYSRGWVLSCFNKIMPFLDTYYAPFKKSSRYWTGFLLLVRCILFLTFIFNALGNSSINLLTITSVTVTLAAFAWLQNRLYLKLHNDILEASFILNLCVLSAATYHVKETGEHQEKLANTSAGIAFLTFIGIIAYHIFVVSHKSGMSLWKRFFHSNRERHDSVFTEDTLSTVPTTTIELRDPLLN